MLKIHFLVQQAYKEHVACAGGAASAHGIIKVMIVLRECRSIYDPRSCLPDSTHAVSTRYDMNGDSTSERIIQAARHAANARFR